MGSWGTKPFDNDTALDWLVGLETAEDGGYLAETLSVIAQSGTPLDTPHSEKGLAAGAVLAAAAFDPIRNVPDAAKNWISTRGYVPPRDLLVTALSIVERIIASSELRELWMESGSLASWKTSTDRLAARLREAVVVEPPARRPKPRGMPRVLYKLVELEGAAADPSLRQKIRTRIEALGDANERCRETGWDTPLGMLARTPLVDEARLLIARGADLNFDWGLGAPLTIACAAGQVEMASALLDAGAQLIAEILLDARSGRPMKMIADPASAQPTVFRCAPALYAAARSGTPATIDLLLARGADLRQLDLQGETLLHKAAQGGNASTLRHLISLGLDVNQTNPRSNESPLHYAVKGGHLEVVRLLLESGADPNLVETYFDQSALDRAGDESTPMFQQIRRFGGLRASEIDPQRESE